MLKDDRPVKRYSESFKLKVLSELENGEKTKAEIVRDYRIGTATLYGWIKKYSKFDLLNKHLRVETMEEKDRIKSLEEEVKKLKEALVDKDLKLFLDENYLKVVSEKLGYTSVDELKKNLEEKPSKK